MKGRALFAALITCALVGCAVPGVPGWPSSIETFSALAHGDTANKRYGPSQVVSDSQGTIWVMYSGSNKLAKMSPEGELLEILEIGAHHTAIAIDPQGALWLLNSDETLSKVDATGRTIGTYAVASNPLGLAVGPTGEAWVSNNGSNSLTRLSSSGDKLGTVSLQEAPVRLAIDGSGDVWVTTRTDHGDKNLVKVSSDGESQEAFTLHFDPYAIQGDPAGGIWLSDSEGTIHRLAPDGTSLSRTPIGGTIWGLACTPQGELWLTRAGAGPGNDQVITLSPKGIKKAEYSAGPNPAALTIDPAGRVWFLNALNGTVGRITPSKEPPPSISPETMAQLSFVVTGPGFGSSGLVTRMGGSLGLETRFNYRTAPVSWRVEDLERATIDDQGRLTPLRPGPIRAVATVEDEEVSVLVATTQQPAPDVKPIRLPDGITGSARSPGARIITSQAEWDETIRDLFRAVPPPSPSPVIPIDFGTRSVLLVAYSMDHLMGGPVVTHIESEPAPRLHVTYPRRGEYNTIQPGGIANNLIFAFNIPQVPPETAVEVTGQFYTGVAGALALLD